MQELRPFVTRLIKAKTVEEIQSVLSDFSRFPWHLTERSIIHAIYSPKAFKLLQQDDRKWQKLEDLEPLCWGRVS